MEYMIGIALGVATLIWFASKMKKGMEEHDSFFTQVKFIQMYMSDSTGKLFYNKSKEEAVELGQELLWAAAEDFNERMHTAVIEQQPIPVGDMGLITSAIRIIKCAESMVYIEKNGPLYEDDITEDDAQETEA